MYTNYPGMMFFLGITFTAGCSFLYSPLTIAKLLLWRFNSWDEDLLPGIREARRIINEDPAEYKQKFWYQLVVIRIMGLTSGLMFMFGLLVLLSDLFLD